MRIGRRPIGPDHPAYVIAEIGVNHDGDPMRALVLTRLAAGAGADAVKFQLFRADMLMSSAARLAAYQRDAGETDPIEMLRRLELPIEVLARCADLAHDLGVHAIVSVFSVGLVGEAEGIAWDAYKAASPDVIHRPLLQAMAGAGRPLIVSTGAAELAEVERAVGWLAGAGDRLALLQCVSSYPTPDQDAELGGVPALARAFPALPIGYSDHTRGDWAGEAAVRAGACILEKHFTDDPSRAGPDHAASLGPDAFARYAARARAAHHDPLHQPPAVKRVLPVEADVRRLSRQSIVTARDLRRGHAIGRDDLTIKRPGVGLAPFELEAILGRRVTRDLPADVPIIGADLA